jgi:hypothetical protein
MSKDKKFKKINKGQKKLESNSVEELLKEGTNTFDIDQVLDEIDNTLGEKASSSFGPAYKKALQRLMESKYEFATQRGTWERVAETLGLLSLEIGAAVQGTLAYLRKKITGK